jgi:GNAT superfamily N-acetyltransferase
VSAPGPGTRGTAGSVLVREAAVTDLDALRDLFVHLQPVRPWREDQDAQARAMLAAIVADPNRRLLVAEVDGAVAGMIDVIVVPNLNRDLRPWVTMENLAVAPAYRRRGLARALVGQGVEVAKSLGCYKVQFQSGARRTQAHALYESMGFDFPVRGFRRYLVDVDLTGI